MSEKLLAKMFQIDGAFSHPVVVWLCLALCLALILTPLLLWFFIGRTGAEPDLRRELRSRYFSWVVLVPVMAGPVLLGPGCVVVAVAVLSLLCHAEFARATGLFRFRLISLVVVLGIAALAFAEM
ncbi:MAG: phosphatidate cytidylyltransferase, partial [Phycisphaerae bacterium]|nr:phosphatidate cytidylyltransferase [Phycisphaerae bacterium]